MLDHFDIGLQPIQALLRMWPRAWASRSVTVALYHLLDHLRTFTAGPNGVKLPLYQISAQLDVVTPHARMLESIEGLRAVRIRSASQLAERDLEGLVLPGGESTVQLEMIARLDLEAPLLALIDRGVPVLATCAGMILLAHSVEQPAQRSFARLDIDVTRNGWGRQIESFEAQSDGEQRPLVFIRAPRIVRVGPSVEVLDTFRGEPILVRQGAIVCATFHPELTADASLHCSVFRPPRPRLRSAHHGRGDPSLRARG